MQSGDDMRMPARPAGDPHVSSSCKSMFSPAAPASRRCHDAPCLWNTEVLLLWLPCSGPPAWPRARSRAGRGIAAAEPAGIGASAAQEAHARPRQGRPRQQHCRVPAGPAPATAGSAAEACGGRAVSAGKIPWMFSLSGRICCWQDLTLRETVCRQRAGPGAPAWPGPAAMAGPQRSTGWIHQDPGTPPSHLRSLGCARVLSAVLPITARAQQHACVRYLDIIGLPQGQPGKHWERAFPDVCAWPQGTAGQAQRSSQDRGCGRGCRA